MGVNYYILRESKHRGGGGFLSYMKKYIYIIYYIKEIMWQKFLTGITLAVMLAVLAMLVGFTSRVTSGGYKSQ